MTVSEELPPVAGHRIYRDDSQHAFLIDQRILACTPVEYRLLTLLFQGRCVPYDQLLAQLTDPPKRKRVARQRMARFISDIRAKLWPLGLDVACLNNTGYLLLDLNAD